MGEGRIRVEQRGRIGWITMDRPPLNVVTAYMCDEITQAVLAFDASQDINAIVLTANGDRAFAAGADVGEHTAEKVRMLTDAIFRLVQTLRKPNGKPRIAAVKGICSGGGNELAFACDFVVARGDTRFALPEINIGVVSVLAAYLIAQKTSPSKVLELAMTGEWISAEEMLRLGMATRIIPVDDYEKALDAYISLFEKKSAAALTIGRDIFHEATRPGALDSLTLLHDRILKEAVDIADYHEGVAAFLEKRQPIWVHA